MYIFFLFIFFLLSSNEENIPPNEQNIPSKASLLKSAKPLEVFIANNINEINKDEDLLKSIIKLCIEVNSLNLLETLLDRLKQMNNKNYSKILNTIIQSKIGELKEYYSEFAPLDSSNLKVVPPAFYYEMYYTVITLEIHFTHNHNSPGCSVVDDYYATLYNRNNSFHFNANCTIGDDEIYFNLDLNFYEPVKSIQEIRINRGFAVVKIIKHNALYWPSLLRKGDSIPFNMRQKSA